MALQLLNGDDQAERDHATDESLGEQGNDHGEETGDHRTDQRDERAEKHQRGQRQRQRNTHDRQAGADTDRVDERDQERGAHVTDERSEAGPAGVTHPLLHVRGKDLGDELPNVAAAVQEENQREQDQQCAGDDFGDGRRRRQRTAGQPGLIVLQRLDRRVAGIVDLLFTQVRGPLHQPLPGGLDALRDLFDQPGQADDELADDEREDAADNRYTGQQYQRHRAAAGGAAPIQEVDGGDQQRGEYQRQRDRDHDQFEPSDHPEHRDDERKNDQQPPRPRGRLADEELDRLVGNRVKRGARWHAGSVTAGPGIPGKSTDGLRRARVRGNIPGTCTATL